MSKIFEDEFMEIQSGLISLCLEVTEKKVDKIFAYASIEKYTTMFHAFFLKDGKIMTADDMHIKDDLVWQFLRLGTKDLMKIRNICKEYNMPIPHEIKMYYDVVTGKFDAKYKYEEVCSADKGIIAEDIFRQWRLEEEKNLMN